jgi:hypothetical protein
MTRITNDLNVCVRVNYAYTGCLGVAQQAFLTYPEQSVRWGGGSEAWISGGHYAGYEYTIEPRTRVAIDPNVRVRGNGTYVGFEDVSGPLVVGDQVEVYEVETSLTGLGRVTEIDSEKELVYLSVDWSSLSDEAESQIPHTESMSKRALFVPTATADSDNEPGWMKLAARPSLACLVASDVGVTVAASAFGWATGISNAWSFSASLSPSDRVVNDLSGCVVKDLMAVTA